MTIEPEQMKAGEKISIPAAFLAGQEEAAQRKALLGEWRRYLTHQQRKALDEEGSSAGFRTRIPLEALKGFTPEEREELAAHEEAEYRRFAPLAEARRTQRLAYVSAGGAEEEFDEMWAAGGREMTIAEIATGGEIEHSRDRFSSPY